MKKRSEKIFVPKARKKITLFSWKEIITFSGYENTEFKNTGWKHLFEKTHRVFAELANENPDKDFFIMEYYTYHIIISYRVSSFCVAYY